MTDEEDVPDAGMYYLIYDHEDEEYVISRYPVDKPEQAFMTQVASVRANNTRHADALFKAQLHNTIEKKPDGTTGTMYKVRLSEVPNISYFQHQADGWPETSVLCFTEDGKAKEIKGKKADLIYYMCRRITDLINEE